MRQPLLPLLLEKVIPRLLDRSGDYFLISSHADLTDGRAAFASGVLSGVD